jgi:hypothetical protein
MNKEQYYKIINQYAIKCLEQYPPDPMAETMEYANGELVGSTPEFPLQIKDVLKISTGNVSNDWDSEYANVANELDRQDMIDLANAVDMVDSDLCDRICEIQTTDKEYQYLLDEGSLVTFLDGTIFYDIDDLIDYREKHEQPYRDNLTRSEK